MEIRVVNCKSLLLNTHTHTHARALYGSLCQRERYRVKRARKKKKKKKNLTLIHVYLILYFPPTDIVRSAIPLLLPERKPYWKKLSGNIEGNIYISQFDIPPPLNFSGMNL